MGSKVNQTGFGKILISMIPKYINFTILKGSVTHPFLRESIKFAPQVRFISEHYTLPNDHKSHFQTFH